MKKGKLYIKHSASIKGAKSHTEVLHGVKESNVEDHLKKRGALMVDNWFVPSKTNRQVRIHGDHTPFNNPL